jgi:hypothetical protein
VKAQSFRVQRAGVKRPSWPEDALMIFVIHRLENINKEGHYGFRVYKGTGGIQEEGVRVFSQ